MSKIRQFLHKRKTILLYFILSYLLILLIPVVFGGIIYFKSLTIIEDEITRADDAILKQIQQSLDSKLSEIEQLAIKLELDPRIRELMHVGDEAQPILNYNKYWLYNEFRTYLLLNEFVSRFYFYLHESDSILASNGAYSPKNYFELHYKTSNITFEEWYAQLLRPRSKTYIEINSEIIFTKPLIPYASINPEDAMGSVVFHLKMKDWTQEDTILIMNEDDHLMFTSDRERYNEPIDYDLLTDYEAVGINYAGQDMIAFTVPSGITSWKYVSLVPLDLFMYKASSIRRLTLVILAFILVMGGFLVYFFSRQNYRPIIQLMRLIGKTSGHDRDRRFSRNEYKVIEETVSNIVLEHKNMERKVDQQSYTLRDYFLVRLIKGKSNDNISMQDMQEYYMRHFKSEDFAVMLFYLENIYDEREEELITFIAKNIIKDKINELYIGFVVEVDQFIVCLVNFDHSDHADRKKDLLLLAGQTQSFIAKKFGILCSVSISRTRRTLEGIKFAYQEAMDAIEYKLIFGSESIIHYEDIQNRKQEITSQDFFKDREQKFSNYVKTEDFRGAKQIVHEMLGNFDNVSVAPIDIVKCNMFGLISTVIATIGEFNIIMEKDFLNKLAPIDRLVNCKTFPQLEKEICAILDEIEGYVKQKNQINISSLKDKVVAMIEEHYQNPDLNVSMIADQLEVNLAYLSKFFKQQTGEGLLDYIQKVRIQKAQALMVNNNYSVKELATLVGYTNLGTFTRLFKKYAGVTPGKYKG